MQQYTQQNSVSINKSAQASAPVAAAHSAARLACLASLAGRTATSAAARPATCAATPAATSFSVVAVCGILGPLVLALLGLLAGSVCSCCARLLSPLLPLHFGLLFLALSRDLLTFLHASHHLQGTHEPAISTEQCLLCGVACQASVYALSTAAMLCTATLQRLQHGLLALPKHARRSAGAEGHAVAMLQLQHRLPRLL